MASHHLDVASSHLYFSFATQRKELPPQAVGHGTTRGLENQKIRGFPFKRDFLSRAQIRAHSREASLLLIPQRKLRNSSSCRLESDRLNTLLPWNPAIISINVNYNKPNVHSWFHTLLLIRMGGPPPILGTEQNKVQSLII